MKEFTGEFDEKDLKMTQVPKKRKRRKKRYFLKFLIFLGVCVLIYFGLSSSYFNIRHISVSGNHYYTDQEVINMADAKKGKNIFFKSGKQDMVKRLEKDPYFADVKVKRSLPSTLKIVVKERVQTAAVAYGDQYVVIDNEGNVLRKTGVMPKVTLLTGLTISKMEVGEPIEVEEKETLGVTLDMLHAMVKGDIYFKKIDISKVIIRAYIYDNLIVKGKPEHLMNAIKSGSLQKVVTDLFDDGISRGTINIGGNDYMSFSPEIG